MQIVDAAWGIVSFPTVIVSFALWCGWPTKKGQGIAALVFLLSLGSLITALALAPQ